MALCLQNSQKVIRNVVNTLLCVIIIHALEHFFPAFALAVAALGAALLGASTSTKTVAQVALTGGVAAVSALVTSSGMVLDQLLDATPAAHFQFLAWAFNWQPHFAIAVPCCIAAVAGETGPSTNDEYPDALKYHMDMQIEKPLHVLQQCLYVM